MSYLHILRVYEDVLWTQRLFQQVGDLKSRCNGDINRYFLLYYDIHPGEPELSKRKKNVGWELGFIHRLLVGWRQISMQACRRL